LKAKKETMCHPFVLTARQRSKKYGIGKSKVFWENAISTFAHPAGQFLESATERASGWDNQE